MRVEHIGNATHIYALCEANGRVRYVGKTIRSITQRFSQHKTASKRSELPVARWLRKTPDAKVILLETVSPGGDWAAREAYWINFHSDLLNLTAGGEGLAGHVFSDEHKSKIANALRKSEPIICEGCGCTFYKKPCAQRTQKHHFCSRDCYLEWQRGRPKNVPHETITKAINAAAEKRRGMTHCKRGHPLSGDNLFLTGQGSRGCKECRKLHKAAYRRKVNG